MPDYLVALDVGGTKTHVVVETAGGARCVDTTIASQDWDAEPADAAAAWLVARIEPFVPGDGRVTALALGAQGVNRIETAEALRASLSVRGYAATVVNDAALVVPAAGVATGIGIIAGTGAIGVGLDTAGRPLAAGGWGCVIGDEGSAASIVRDAVRSALASADAGHDEDGLLGALLASFGVADAERLTRQVNDDPRAENWAPHCPAVFAAEANGSALARSVVDQAARDLAGLVDRLVARGAVGADVVAAGSVIVNQPSLFASFASAIQGSHPTFRVSLLDRPPVEGAVGLVREAHARPAR